MSEIARIKAETDDEDEQPPEDETRTGATREESGSPPIYPPPTAPFAVARQLYQGCRDADGLRTLLAYRGDWQLWRTIQWSEVDAAEIRSRIYRALEHAYYVKVVDEVEDLVPWDPTRHKVANVLEAMAAIGHLSSEVDAPAWIEALHSAKSSAAQVISCQHGLLDLDSRTLHEHTAALFNFVSVPFDYDDDAPEPTAWLAFLKSLWGDDRDSIALLQEYFGYVLCGRLDMQKMLLLVGPIRGGKGTIARMLTALMGGRRNVPGPTLASMNTNFGLSPLIGKPLAIVSDARLGNVPSHTVVERLLSITGEDTLTIDRKYREPWTGKLPTRFVMLTNELPKFRDSSTAIATRMLILRMTESFLNREDHELEERLRPELPGILMWSLEGLDRLNRKGRFTLPSSSADMANLMADMASPVSAFVRDCCVRKPNARVLRDDLYAAWKNWAEGNGHHPGAKSTFGRDLRAVVPELGQTQPRASGGRVWFYTHIGLMPVPPVPDDEDAGQGDFGGIGSPVPGPVPHQMTFDAADAGTGSPVPADGTNSQVNRGGTSGTGQRPMYAQNESADDEPHCVDCDEPLTRPESIARGRCAECQLTANDEGNNTA